MVKEWDPPPLLPEPLVPLKYEDPGGTHFEHGGTSVMKRGSSESGLSDHKWTLSSCKVPVIMIMVIILIGDSRSGPKYAMHANTVLWLEY